MAAKKTKKEQLAEIQEQYAKQMPATAKALPIVDLVEVGAPLDPPIFLRSNSPSYVLPESQAAIDKAAHDLSADVLAAEQKSRPCIVCGNAVIPGRICAVDGFTASK